MTTIGILTGGGDVPGLNPCIKAVVMNALENGYRVIGIRRGWGGLLHYNFDEPSTRDYYVKELARRRCADHRPYGWYFLTHLPNQPAKSVARRCARFLEEF